MTVNAWTPTEYPPYCFKNTGTHNIPPLSATQLTKVSSLKQVQIIIRHGARTPYQKYTCWADYNVAWNNCNVTELVLPSDSYTSQHRDSSWLFRKIYDGSANFLGGNCLTGQLLYEGYEQEEANGNILKTAYLQNNDPKLNLFPTDQWDELNTTTEIYLRSDDQERTMLSGQVLLHTFFNVSKLSIINWHTGDYDLDQIYPNSQVCPRLSTLEASIKASTEYQNENSSAKQVNLNGQLDVIMGKGQWRWSYIFDCLMTTVCTDRPTPDGSAEEGVVMDQTIFDNTIEQVEYTYAYTYLYNDSEYAKLAMGNTAWHVRTNLENMLATEGQQSVTTNPKKLVLFGAHDTTVMPFLAAILKKNWDGHWAGYASLVTIELYESAADVDSQDPSDDLFRIVYNGVPQLVPGCDDTLCNINILLDALSFGQESMPCAVPVDPDSTDDIDDGDCEQKSSLSDTDWILLLLLSLFLGVVIGVGAVVFIDKRQRKYGNIADEMEQRASSGDYEKVNAFHVGTKETISPFMDEDVQ